MSDQSGYVYVLSNPAMPGLVKVGATTETPMARMRQLDTAGVPRPFVLEFCLTASDAWAVEERAHNKLSGVRYGKEFFQCEVEREVLAVLLETRHLCGESAWRMVPARIVNALIDAASEASGQNGVSWSDIEELVVAASESGCLDSVLSETWMALNEPDPGPEEHSEKQEATE